MTEIKKAEQVWKEKIKIEADYRWRGLPDQKRYFKEACEFAMSSLKSSLQREIEKKLSILNNQGSTSPTAEKILFAKIDAYNVFLELLNTVEP